MYIIVASPVPFGIDLNFEYMQFSLYYFLMYLFPSLLWRKKSMDHHCGCLYSIHICVYIDRCIYILKNTKYMIYNSCVFYIYVTYIYFTYVCVYQYTHKHTVWICSQICISVYFQAELFCQGWGPPSPVPKITSKFDYIVCPCRDFFPSLIELNSLTWLFLSSQKPEKILNSIDMYSKGFHADSEK